MLPGESLFLSVLRTLRDEGVLRHLVLLGSWTLPVYRRYFDDDPRIPLLRTTDLDFLVSVNAADRKRYDVPRVLEDMGFEPLWATEGGYCKFVTPDMEVEFLVPERGQGAEGAVKIEPLGLNAQPLRYLGLAEREAMSVPYQGIDVRVPKPASFVLIKLLVFPRRKDVAKARKDMESARAVGLKLLDAEDQRRELIALHQSLPGGWKKTIGKVAREHFQELLDASKD